MAPEFIPFFASRFWAKNVASTSETESSSSHTASTSRDLRKLETRATLRRIIVRS